MFLWHKRRTAIANKANDWIEKTKEIKIANVEIKAVENYLK